MYSTHWRRLKLSCGPLSLACAFAIVASGTVAPGAAVARVLAVGPNAEFKAPSAAINKAQDGDVVQIAKGEYFDCAFVRANNLTIEGTGPDASAVITDTACGGKALLVVSGNNVTVRNVTLTRARVADGNGAGIRAEGKGLTVDHVKFINNQEGILGGPPDTTMVITNSEFVRNGNCPESGGCAHGVYVGEVALLHIENTKFVETRTAHHIKSRAKRTEVINCDISDGDKGTASYEIELPIGGDLLARGNTIFKGPMAENHTGAIVIGAEGVKQKTRELLIENNTFRADGDYNTYFVVNRTATAAVLTGNKVSGNAKPLLGDGTVDGR